MCEACGYEEAIADADEIINTANQIDEENTSESAMSFADSVREKAIGMKDWMEKNSHVTERMVNALSNMLEGAQRWVKNEGAPKSKGSKSAYRSDLPF